MGITGRLPPPPPRMIPGMPSLPCPVTGVKKKEKKEKREREREKSWPGSSFNYTHKGRGRGQNALGLPSTSNKRLCVIHAET